MTLLKKKNPTKVSVCDWSTFYNKKLGLVSFSPSVFVQGFTIRKQRLKLMWPCFPKHYWSKPNHNGEFSCLFIIYDKVTSMDIIVHYSI